MSPTKSIRWIALLSTSVLLAGCATGSGNFCDVASPIRPSISDKLTDVTARQILAHDETGSRLCGWRP